MKKLFFAVAAVATMLIVHSCSADDNANNTNQNALDRKQIAPSAVTDSIPIINPDIIDDGGDERDKDKG